MGADTRQSLVDKHEQSHHLDQLNAISLSANLAWGVLVGLVFNFRGMFLPMYRFEETLYHRWGVSGAGGATSGYLAFAVWVTCLAAALLLLMWCLSLTPVGGWLLRYAAGYIALGVAPACWSQTLSRYGYAWYPVEVAVATLLLTLFMIRRRPFPVKAALLITVVHYALWFRRYWDNSRSPLELLVPPLGCCACLAWGAAYIQRARPGSDSNLTPSLASAVARRQAKRR
jgi:hypothetical protein